MTMRTELHEGLQSCPAHADRRASLSVRRTADGKTLVHCHAGCSTEAVLAALGLQWVDLFPEAPRSTRTRRALAWDSPLMGARRQILRQARRQAWARGPILELYHISDFVRCADRMVAAVRRVSTILGPSAQVWNALDVAAGVERFTLQVEADLDRILGAGRIV